MKVTHPLFLATAFLGATLIILSGAECYKQYNSSRAVIPLVVSLTKHQYDEGEPITISILLTNPLSRQITVCRLSFGLAEHHGEEGFYVYNDEIRDKCRGHYVSDIGMVSGMVDVKLQPKETMNGAVIIPVDDAFTQGSYAISYELRIPFYGCENQFRLSLDNTVTVYLDPRDRPNVDVWKDRAQDFINGNGVFTVKGKLQFIVK